MKTRNKILVTILVIVLMIGLVWNVFGPFLFHQTLITGYVKSHADELEQIAQDAGYVRQSEGLIKIQKSVNRPDMVEFECWAFGIVPASTYKGFYYSENDEPIPFQGVMQKLTADGNGWAWQEPESDNHGYTEKIMDNWYYYEASL